MSAELTIAYGMTIDQIMVQKMRVAELMEKVLKEGEHYGVIPGTNKKTLYKSGAETIALTFGIHPKFEIERFELLNGHREYQVKSLMFRNSDGMALASGVGICSSMEGKYRWRKKKSYNQETRKEIEELIENPNLQDQFNTILKMAKKRAFVDAVITATAASDFVNQDLEDFQDFQVGKLEPRAPQPWDADLATIIDMEALKDYYLKNSGKGKEFAEAVGRRKEEIEKIILQS